MAEHPEPPVRGPTLSRSEIEFLIRNRRRRSQFALQRDVTRAQAEKLLARVRALSLLRPSERS